MIWWILFVLKYLFLYITLTSLSYTIFCVMNFWTGRVNKAALVVWPECLAFVIYLMLSNFV